jgi:alpha-tubulin suppressor-like RCC1 family protein
LIRLQKTALLGQALNREERVTGVSAGSGIYSPNLVLLADGSVRQWGPAKQVGLPLSGYSNIVSVSAGGGHSLALTKEGLVIGWGDNNAGQATGNANPVAPYQSTGFVAISGRALTNIVAVSAGNGYSLALSKDGRVIGWGGNRWGTTDIPSNLGSASTISAGDSFCLAIGR